MASNPEFPALQASCNSKLQIKLEAVSTALEDGYEVVFQLVTTGQLTADARNDYAAFRSMIADFEHPEASLTLVDSDTIQTKWTEAAGKNLPKITHALALEPGRYLAVDVANFKTVVAAVRLVDCLKFPGNCRWQALPSECSAIPRPDEQGQQGDEADPQRR